MSQAIGRPRHLHPMVGEGSGVLRSSEEKRNYVDGSWRVATGSDVFDVWNPATGVVTARVRASSARDVAQAVAAAERASRDWRKVSPNERVQWLFQLKTALEENLEDLARCVTEEHGKLINEARGEVRRAIDNVEMACGTPANLQGLFAEDIATGVDETMIRQPLGVSVAIVPFNFPVMIPCWFLPYAVACGNSFILKASERTPCSAGLLFELIDTLDLPPGVVNLVHGGVDTAQALIEHPGVQSVSFVGSTPAARAVYTKAAAAGKRVQAQGGAKNALVVLPDAQIDQVAPIVAESAFGNAGQRCLAGGTAIAVGDAGDDLSVAIAELAAGRRLGNGLHNEVELGPVITSTSRQRVEALIGVGESEGARILTDGRGASVAGHEGGFFVGATVLDGVPPGSSLATTEVFGPVLAIQRARDLDEAIKIINDGRYGNMACLFTSSGEAARRFRHEARVGNVGINVGVAQPMASFPFSGWGESFFGDLHAHGHHAIEFFSQTKVVVERWP
jgi:malonate-semialdehyde dehydrogenase (acetylating) / methylmalonate-semialdehyde dehydrogenase